MRELSKIKTVMSRYYSKYEGYIDPVLKLIFAFTIITILNGRLGYMKRIDNLAVTLVLSLICSFMPLMATTFVSGFVMLAHVYALGTGYALVFAALLMLMLLVYIRFVPSETLVILITPVLFLVNFPYIMPLVMGIVGNPLSVISVGFGVVLAFMVMVLSGEGVESTGMVEDIKFLMESLLQNKAMLFTAGIFAVVLVIVYVIRRSPIKYARMIAISIGAVTEILFLIIGKSAVKLEFSVAGIIVGSIIAGVCCSILALFNYRLDYSKTENLQFEDNDYYYYVKAVPKINYTAGSRDKTAKYDMPPQRRVQEAERKPVSRVNTINSINGERHSSQNRKTGNDIYRESANTTASGRAAASPATGNTGASGARAAGQTPQSRSRSDGAVNSTGRQQTGRSSIPDRSSTLGRSSIQDRSSTAGRSSIQDRSRGQK